MATKRASGTHRIDRLCPLPVCIAGIVWHDGAPVGECPICKGTGRVSLSDWMRFTFDQAKKP